MEPVENTKNQEKRGTTREDNANFFKYIANPRAYTIRKWFYDILKQNYGPHEDVIERMGAYLVTDKDVQGLGNLIMAVYEAAYRKAIDDCSKQAANLGVNFKVVIPNSNQG